MKTLGWCAVLCVVGALAAATQALGAGAYDQLSRQD